MPLVMGEGGTPEACYRDTLEAATASIALMLEKDQSPPAPAREGKRDQQINIRLSSSEKLKLERAADRAGYRSLSDFMRAAAIQATNEG